MIQKLVSEKPYLQFNVAFVPLLNPDGADLCKNGVKNLKKPQKKRLLTINKCENFAFFKANAHGFDINNNFDANWKNKFGKKQKPCSQGFYGKRSFSEPETIAIKSLTEKLKPFLTISYHLKGKEIYYDFFQWGKRRERDRKIAEIFAKSTGYKIVSTESVSSGGYKDWCVKKLRIAAITIELGDDKFSHPYPESEIDSIFEKNEGIFDCLTQALLVYNEFEEKFVEEKFMKKALALAEKAYENDEVPIGAVIVKDGKVLSFAFNKREKSNDATAHAEILAIQKACKKLGDFRLADCDIYVTLEPCTMCMGAILNARIKNLYFGAYANKENVLSCGEINERAGLNHKTTIVGGVLKDACERLVKDYFADKRK